MVYLSQQTVVEHEHVTFLRKMQIHTDQGFAT